MGAENTTALMVNLGNAETFVLEIMSTRWGPGLGGSGGAAFIIGFGFIEPYVLHGENLNDWGVNIAFTEKLVSRGSIRDRAPLRHRAPARHEGLRLQGDGV